jgi:hypothetical protein
MATIHVEMREGERWDDIADAFMGWCLREKQLTSGGCCEGDAITPSDGRRYAAINMPDHSPHLVELLYEWALREGRTIK